MNAKGIVAAAAAVAAVALTFAAVTPRGAQAQEPKSADSASTAMPGNADGVYGFTLAADADCTGLLGMPWMNGRQFLARVLQFHGDSWAQIEPISGNPRTGNEKRHDPVWLNMKYVLLMEAESNSQAVSPPPAIQQRNLCQENQARIDGVIQLWAQENNKPATAVPTWADLVGPSLYIRATPACPAGGVYTLQSVASHPTCSDPQHPFPKK